MKRHRTRRRRDDDTTTSKTNGVSRRSVLKGAAARRRRGRWARGAITGFPTIWAQNTKNITLRQFGTGVSNINAIAEKCKADLGITLEMTALDSDAVAQRAVTQPNSYDIADIEYWIVQEGLPGRRPAADGRQEDQVLRQDRAALHHRQADARQRHRPGHGAAHRRLRRRRRARPSFAKGQTEWFTMIPTIYNADTLGIRPDLVGREITNWKDILDPDVQGQDRRSSTSRRSASWTPR